MRAIYRPPREISHTVFLPWDISSHQVLRCEVLGDCLNVVRWINGDSYPSHGSIRSTIGHTICQLSLLWQQGLLQPRENSGHFLRHIQRELNTEADAFAGASLDHTTSFFSWEPYIILQADAILMFFDGGSRDGNAAAAWVMFAVNFPDSVMIPGNAPERTALKAELWKLYQCDDDEDIALLPAQKMMDSVRAIDQDGQLQQMISFIRAAHQSVYMRGIDRADFSEVYAAQLAIAAACAVAQGRIVHHNETLLELDSAQCT